MSTSLRIANGAGFWGDSPDAPLALAQPGLCDVLTLEYLAELTLAILAHLRSRDPNAGFIPDFPRLVPRLLPWLQQDQTTRIVTNAGGLNPLACVRAAASALPSSQGADCPIAAILGDDLLPRIPDLLQAGLDLPHLETGAPLQPVAGRLVAANAYLGARPIADALAQGARIVVTGRVADAALTLGPAVSRFNWSWDDWPRLAGATAAGHVLECGAQATGGLWHDWANLPDPDHIGYPIAEIDPNGRCVITKPPGSGGIVSTGTVAEQLIYEIDDPSAYHTPDLLLDLTTIQLRQLEPDRVLLSAATGRPPSGNLKVSCILQDGWTASGLLAVAGDHADRKARAAGQWLLQRLARAGQSPAHALVEVIGAGDLVPGCGIPAAPPFEVVLRVTARDPRRELIDRFTREFAPLATSGPPGIAGYASGRPDVRPAFAYHPCLIPREFITPRLHVRPARDWIHAPS